jgi:hypothetical protein
MRDPQRQHLRQPALQLLPCDATHVPRRGKDTHALETGGARPAPAALRWPAAPAPAQRLCACDGWVQRQCGCPRERVQGVGGWAPTNQLFIRTSALASGPKTDVLNLRLGMAGPCDPRSTSGSVGGGLADAPMSIDPPAVAMAEEALVTAASPPPPSQEHRPPNTTASIRPIRLYNGEDGAGQGGSVLVGVWGVEEAAMSHARMGVEGVGMRHVRTG